MARTKKAGRARSKGTPPEESKNAPSEDTAPATPPEKRQKVKKAPAGILEEGQIYFLYRPRVGFETAHGLGDVQRFYLVLMPDNASQKRLLVIGKKKVPAKQERFFAFTEAVSEDVEELIGGLGPTDRETKTLGTRHTEPARIAGQEQNQSSDLPIFQWLSSGKYSIAEKDQSNTYLIWRLEVPQEPADVQNEFGITKEGSLAISIKNPKKANPGPSNIGLDTKADFGDKQKLFDGIPGGYAWIPAKDPSLLDHLNAEILLIGAGDDIEERLGEEVEEHIKDEAEAKAADAGVDGSTKNTEEDEEKLVKEMRNELGADTASLDAAPAENKEWK